MLQEKTVAGFKAAVLQTASSMALVPCQSCFEGIKIAIRCVRWQISPAGSLNPWLTPH